MQAYKQFEQGCTIFDVVLQLYLTLNMLPKLILDNHITDLNTLTTTGQSFVYDTEFIDNEQMAQEITKKNYKFKTSDLKIRNNSIIGDYLLIESAEILQDEANNLFIY
jgi:hypothetical protein